MDEAHADFAQVTVGLLEFLLVDSRRVDDLVGTWIFARNAIVDVRAVTRFVDARHLPAEAGARTGIGTVAETQFVAVVLARRQLDFYGYLVAAGRQFARRNIDGLEKTAVIESQLQADQLVQRIEVAGGEVQVTIQQLPRSATGCSAVPATPLPPTSAN